MLKLNSETFISVPGPAHYKTPSVNSNSLDTHRDGQHQYNLAEPWTWMPSMPTSRRRSYSPSPRRDMALALTMVCYCTWISEPAVITASLISLGRVRCALMRQVFNVKLLSGEGLLMREHVCFVAAAELPWRLTERRHLGLVAGGGLASVTPLPRGQVPSARGAEVNSHWDGGWLRKGPRLYLSDGHERLLFEDMQENLRWWNNIMN